MSGGRSQGEGGMSGGCSLGEAGVSGGRSMGEGGDVSGTLAGGMMENRGLYFAEGWVGQRKVPWRREIYQGDGLCGRTESWMSGRASEGCVSGERSLKKVIR